MNEPRDDGATPPASPATEAAETPLMARSAPPPRRLEIRFTGSGSEYFRIWAVNLLLILLSCGLYLPFAKMRRIRYFYANTLIGGDALAFHGAATKMFRGFILLAALTLIYTFAGSFSPAAALPAFLLLCAVWPALWRASLQYRLSNTSWRGLRLVFEGSMRDAYLAFMPVYVPAILVTIFTPEGTGPSQDPGVNSQLALVMSLLLLAVMAPWSTTLIKRYQHKGYRIAAQHTEVALPAGAVYAIGGKAAALGVCVLIFALFGGWMVGALLHLTLGSQDGTKGNSLYEMLAFIGLIYLLGGSVVWTYYTERLQNLVWGNTKSAALQFRSTLADLPALTFKNWVLILFTAGLYRPFAVVAAARLRLEAIWIETDSDPDSWTAPARSGRTDASGEVAGDFFGMDLGL
jgi:uncharacterized membrane protein YjgN (DUF898 family)